MLWLECTRAERVRFMLKEGRARLMSLQKVEEEPAKMAQKTVFVIGYGSVGQAWHR